MQIENIKIFPKPIIAGVTLRNIEEYPPYGLSLSQTALIDEAKVIANRKLLADYIGVNFTQMKFQRQIHSDIIRIIDHESEIIESDAMICNEKGLVINISIADCAAILIYDEINNVIAGIHSGWRGTEQNITGKTINLMRNNFNSIPSTLICYITAAASGKNYEVGKDVAQYFPNSVIPIDNGKYLFDNRNEIKLQLLERGVGEQNIFTSDVCTIENENYHSYRRDKDYSGRMSAFICLK